MASWCFLICFSALRSRELNKSNADDNKPIEPCIMESGFPVAIPCATWLAPSMIPPRSLKMACVSSSIDTPIFCNPAVTALNVPETRFIDCETADATSLVAFLASSLPNPLPSLVASLRRFHAAPRAVNGLRFSTSSRALFNWSVRAFKSCGFKSTPMVAFMPSIFAINFLMVDVVNSSRLPKRFCQSAEFLIKSLCNLESSFCSAVANCSNNLVFPFNSAMRRRSAYCSCMRVFFCS